MSEITRKWFPRRTIPLGLGIAALVTGLAQAAEPETRLPFAQIWSLAKARSPSMLAANHESEAARINESRLSRHWYPRAFADARAFSTDDPALSFMSLLGERQILASDFAPAALNEPGSHFYGQVTLGLDLPLYEGGAKVAEHAAAAKAVETKDFEGKATLLRNYADVSESYAELLILIEERAELEKLGASVDETLTRYKVGSRSNPVGYSGLLGLKNLKNRIAGLVIENSTQAQAARQSLEVLAGPLPTHWTPAEPAASEFIAKHLTVGPDSTPHGETRPASVQAAHAAAQALTQSEQVEKARLLPKVGLFADGNFYDGNRGSASGYAAGAYLRWDLFSAPNFGAAGQAEHVARAAEARAEALSQSATIEQNRARTAVDALNREIQLMEESLPLLEEQTRVARELFRNGSINALQLVEVLARRADLLTNRSRAKGELVKAHVSLLLNSNADEVPYGKA